MQTTAVTDAVAGEQTLDEMYADLVEDAANLMLRLECEHRSLFDLTAMLSMNIFRVANELKTVTVH